MTNYTVNGVGFERLSDALDAAQKAAVARLSARCGGRGPFSGSDLTGSTVNVVRNDGTVAATVRP